MSVLEVAKIYTVAEPLDRPVEELTQGQTAVEIQFNPASLQVALANTVGENDRDETSKPAQYIDKSSSTLTVELVFDTTDQYFNREQESEETEEVRKDVRSLTQPIAVQFMRPEAVGDDTVAPKRCLFAWGTFAFVGIMETFDETLEFFSPEGTPLRASVSLKITESRFQFRTEEARAAERDTPTLGSGSGSVAQANSAAGKKDKDWRDTAMYNGIESPRALGGASLLVPSAAATASLKASASIGVGAGVGISGGFSAGIGGSAGIGISGGLSAGVGGGISAGVAGGISAGAGIGGGVSAGVGGSLGAGLSAGAGITSGLGGGLNVSANITPPAFKFGASSSLGTSIPGAFSADINGGGGLSAGSLLTGAASLRAKSNVQGNTVAVNAITVSSTDVNATSSSSSSGAGVSAIAGIGFD